MGICASFRAPTLDKLYEVDERDVLGEGTYSVVFRGKTRASGVPVAVKRIDKQQHALGSPRLWEDEVAMLRQCGEHPNVIALRDVFETPTHVFIVMELAEGGELFQTLISVRHPSTTAHCVMMAFLTGPLLYYLIHILYRRAHTRNGTPRGSRDRFSRRCSSFTNETSFTGGPRGRVLSVPLGNFA